MKSIYLLLLLSILSTAVLAQSNIPQVVSFSAVVRDANNQPLVNTPVSIRLTFKKGGQSGPLVYCALHQDVSNANGFISLQLNRNVLGIGCNGAPSTTFETIPWKEGGFWMEVEYQTVPNTPFTSLGQLELASSFYAFAAGSAEELKGVNLQGAQNGYVLAYNQSTGKWEPTPATAGPQGPIGPTGPQGPQGTQGVAGPAGSAGAAGATGPSGADGKISLVKTSTEAAGANCTTGGTKIETGIDANGNSILETSEINTSLTRYICNGAAGQTGATGPSGPGFANGTTTNQMMYWNGTAWTTLNPGSNGQILTLCNGVLTWTTGGICPSSNPVDVDGNTYTTVTIGTQVWMKENLKVSKYRNGDPIPTNLSDTEWQNTTTGAYAIYNNDAANNTTYGKLYNWYAVADSRNLCPVGWHVPTDGEWKTLEISLGMSTTEADLAGSRGEAQNVAGKLKSTSTLWNAPNAGATNESGFSGLPGGNRYGNGPYNGIGNEGLWWSSTEFFPTIPNPWMRLLVSYNASSGRANYGVRDGLSVRCLRD